MTAQDELADLADRIRAEADVAARPGQRRNLNRIALDLERVVIPPGQEDAEVIARAYLATP